MTEHAFDQTLRDDARRLKFLHPGEGPRLDRGLVLALNGAATYVDGQYWQVRSATDAEVVYTLLPEGCDCPDRQRAPDGRCKHYWAVYLTHAAHLKETPHVED